MATTEPIDVSPEIMLTYYRRLYPFKSIFNWLNHEHAPTRLFTHREFAFTLQGDVYLRYNSFNTAEDLKKQVCQLNPTRFEIGPVYSARPKDKRTVRPGAFVPKQRELVFDIDMTDYDPIRTCCSGADICRKCWKFISVAVQVLDRAIREQFGYEQLLWVYSGRRGIHLWISDKEAMDLTDEQRKALVGWMTVIHGGAKEAGKKLNVRVGGGKLPPSLETALEIAAEHFPEVILEDQDLFATKEGYNTILEFLPDKGGDGGLSDEWATDPTRSSEDKWNDFKRVIKEKMRSDKPGMAAVANSMKAALEDLILYHMYPRIDAEVSKHRNHLLKAPFCVHPKTGRVCVPIDPQRVDRFNPETVPTVGQLLKELDSLQTDDPMSGEHHSDWERTSLKEYVDIMDKHALRLMERVRQEKRATDVTW